MVEYKINRLERKAILMEVNGRYWGSLSLALHAGVNFPLCQWKLVHNEPVEMPTAYGVGNRWRWTGGFFKRWHGLLREVRRSSRARETLGEDFRQLPRDFGPATRDSLFTWADPLPAFRDLAGTVKDLARYLSDDVRGFLRCRIKSGQEKAGASL